MKDEIIPLKIVAHQEVDENAMRFFSKEKGEYSIHRQPDEKGTIYEYCLTKFDGKSMAFVPCFDKKYVEHLKKDSKNTIVVDNDVLSLQ